MTTITHVMTPTGSVPIEGIADHFKSTYIAASAPEDSDTQDYIVADVRYKGGGAETVYLNSLEGLNDLYHNETISYIATPSFNSGTRTINELNEFIQYNNDSSERGGVLDSEPSLRNPKKEIGLDVPVIFHYEDFFWLALIPALCILYMLLMKIFGYA